MNDWISTGICYEDSSFSVVSCPECRAVYYETTYGDAPDGCSACGWKRNAPPVEQEKEVGDIMHLLGSLVWLDSLSEENFRRVKEAIARFEHNAKRLNREVDD